MATINDFKDWLEQNGFGKHAATIIEGGIENKENLKECFQEICDTLFLSEEEINKLKAAIFATDVLVVDDMQKFCEDCNIVQFKDALIKAGYTNPKMFLSKTEDELDNIGKAAGMKFMYLRKFKTAVLEQQQKIEFEQWCQNNGFGKFSQELMKHGIKNNRELVSKSDSELNELCKKCSIQLMFARSFRTAVQTLQEKSKNKKEEKEKETEEMETETKVDVTVDIETTATNEDEGTGSITVNISQEELQTEKLELKVETTLKEIGVRLSKIQESQRKHYRPRFENTLENLSNGKFEEHFRELKDTLGDMKTKGYVHVVSYVSNINIKRKDNMSWNSVLNLYPEGFEIERIFLGLCGFEVKEMIEKDEETKKEEQKKTFDICGSVNKDAVVLMAQKLYLVEQTLAMVIENKNNTNESQVNDTFINQFEHMLRIMKVDLLMLADKQKRGRIYNHASGFYDDQFIVFTLQQFISEVQDSTLAFKPVLNSDYLEKFVNFIGGKSTISTENASKINMDDLKHLKIHPVGLFGTKEEVIWQLQTFNCISKPIQDMLSSEKSEECLSMGLYAIVNLKDAFLKLDKTPKELELMSKSSNVDIVLFFWPDIDSFTDIKRGNSSSLFLRVLLEVCSTVCIKSMGGGIQVEMQEQQKNDVSCNVEKMQSFLIEKERKQDSSNGSVISKRAFVIEGAQSTILCHCSIQEHVTESKPLQFTSSSKEELMNYIKQITQTHQLKLWDKTFDTWEKALIFAESICPVLIEVSTLFFFFYLIV
ncbi:hypothetical protein RFI_21140 [Reticulomyxa filosa]|uniref:Uncharacterized protein n=1 Tax=Reticulomyxa filosa TaxID=46433 RepID=X6MQD7_RETFI|nr:hypothetical protein RFI_21140 [Reticulomyxa filosa]|eukprot:ETO16218.1 hypothetical protein RFI_21140 [Reticulomyxa filosa]